MPKFIPILPGFMVPGPNIKIEKKEGLLVEQPATQTQDEPNDDEDFTPYRYYESTKILGEIYRAINEQEIFGDLHKYIKISSGIPSLLDRIWDHWHHHLTEAQEIRNMYEECLLNIIKNYSEHPLRLILELEALNR
jgi:hypothetical protein